MALIVCSIASLAIAGKPYGLESRIPIGGFINGKLPAAAVVQTGQWDVVEAYPQIEIDDPTALIHEPRSNRLYVSTSATARSNGEIATQTEAITGQFQHSD